MHYKKINRTVGQLIVILLFRLNLNNFLTFPWGLPLGEDDDLLGFFLFFLRLISKLCDLFITSWVTAAFLGQVHLI